MLVVRVRPRRERVQEHLHQSDEAGELRTGRDPRRHRRGRSLIRIRSPLVKRNRGDLEPEPHHQEQDRRRSGHVAGQSLDPRAVQDLAYPLELSRPRHPINKAQSKEKESRGDGSVDEILEPPLRRPPPRLLQSRAQVKANRHRLERQEQRHKLFRRGEQHHPHGGPEHEREILAPLFGERPSSSTTRPPGPAARRTGR